MTQNIAFEDRYDGTGMTDGFQDTAELIPGSLAESKNSGLNMKFIAAGGGLIVLIVALFVFGLMNSSSYWMTVDEVQSYWNTEGQALALAGNVDAKRIRVNGLVVENSEEWLPRDMTLRFSIVDEENPDAQLPIVFYGPRPDNFQRAASAIVEGEMLADGTVQADTLLLKCPSRYEEEPEEIYVEAVR